MTRMLMVLALFAGVAIAQQGPPPPGGMRDGHGGPPPPPPPAPRAGQIGPPGKWWQDEETVKQLGLTDDQRKKMDDVFHQHRLKLIDLHATLQKEEANLEPMMHADQVDDAKILPQVDRVAQARAEIEKADARLLIGLRHVLTADQWKKLQDAPRTPRPGGPGGPDGPGRGRPGPGGPGAPPPPPREE